jgi:hypothetical protein
MHGTGWISATATNNRTHSRRPGFDLSGAIQQALKSNCRARKRP